MENMRMVCIVSLLFIIGVLALSPGCGSDSSGDSGDEGLTDDLIADAGVDQNVKTGTTVSLDGSSSSSSLGYELSYSWEFISLPSGSSAVLSDPTSAKPTFFADLDGTYILHLIVDNGVDVVLSDPVTITATTTNSAPVADAGPNRNVLTGDIVTLDGSNSSDADGDQLTYSWSITSVPAGSSANLSSITSEKPTFMADVDGDYVFSLVVNDGNLDSASDSVTITAITINSAPVADAGPDQNVLTGDIVTLDGSNSSDVDGDQLTYSWSITSVPAGSSANLSSITSEKPTFTADVDGDYVFSLVVNDGNLDSASDSVTITATPPNSAPVADAGPAQTLRTGSLVTLDGSGSNDADGDSITYNWSFTSKPSGSSAVLSDPTIVNPTFTADVDGAYELDLIVSDGEADSIADSVTITAASDPELFFSSGKSSSVVIISGYVQAGSTFSSSIKNNSNETFPLSKCEFINGATVLTSTTDSELLHGNQAIPGDTIGVSVTLSSDRQDNGFAFKYYLTDPVTAQAFEITITFDLSL